MPFATAGDGTRLAYHEIGAGPPLLLVSGQASDHHIWTGLREAFAPRYRVVTFDHRGTGDSDKPEAPPYSTRGFADDAIAVLDHLGIRRAHAYGMSMGGRIGQWLGVAHRDRLGALILGCTTPGNAHGVRRPLHADPVLTSGDPVRMLPYLVAMEWAAANRRITFAERDASALAHPVPPYARQLHFEASEAHDAWDRFPRSPRPRWSSTAVADEMNVAANAPLLAERIRVPSSTSSPAHDTSLWDHGDEANRVVGDFLARHPL